MGAMLVVARALLPIAVQSFVNKTLDAIPDYDGHIGDVDLHLWRGAYEIQDVSLVQTAGNVPVPLFSSPKVDLSVEWGQLFRGKLVGKIDLDDPDEFRFRSGAGRQAGPRRRELDRAGRGPLSVEAEPRDGSPGNHPLSGFSQRPGWTSS